MSAVELLFVDDEPGIRATISEALRREGFAVMVAASVAEALDLITKRKFDVLISDLNIGEPGDGFTVVSAMRRVHPQAITLILTGYPDFESALRAIRAQVDDYLTKPANIPKLVNVIHQRLSNRRLDREPAPTMRVSEMLQTQMDVIIQLWFDQVEACPELSGIPLSKSQRTDHIPGILRELADRIDSERDQPLVAVLDAAALHGRTRYQQGYTVSLLLTEARLLHRAISVTLQANLLCIDLSTLISDLIQIGESLTAELEESIRAFQQQQHSAA